MSNMISVNGVSISIGNNNEVYVNGQLYGPVDQSEAQVNHSKHLAQERIRAFNESDKEEGTYEINGMRFNLNGQGVLTSIEGVSDKNVTVSGDVENVKISGSGNISVEGDVEEVRHSGSGNISVSGDVNKVKHSGAGNVY